MAVLYKSTRGTEKRVNCCEAIISGIAEDGGLYVPTAIPALDKEWAELGKMTYPQLCGYILAKYFPSFEASEIQKSAELAYDNKFETKEIVPLVQKGGVHFLELYHGPTLAFKDMALSLLPHLLKLSIEKEGRKDEVVILTATSGDTGKAALEAFSEVEGVKIIVFFPEKGVSEIQKLQMTTQKGNNTYVVGIEGNFDDAQKAVKEAFSDPQLIKKLGQHNMIFSSANSINIARFIPQVVYYFYGYLSLIQNKKVKAGDKINVVVPTGNFGNILAAYYAKKMGLPIERLICASNENNVLYDFLQSGIYDKNRDFKITNSPSMDILISSNLERLLYEISGGKEERVKLWMEQLSKVGRYEISEEEKEALQAFYGGFATEEETLKAIEEMYNAESYVMDTHTAVAYSVYKKYKKESGDKKETLIVSTASPFKFCKEVGKAIGIEQKGQDEFTVAEKLSEKANLKIPESILALKDRERLHNLLCKKENIKKTIEEILKV